MSRRDRQWSACSMSNVATLPWEASSWSVAPATTLRRHRAMGAGATGMSPMMEERRHRDQYACESKDRLGPRMGTEVLPVETGMHARLEGSTGSDGSGREAKERRHEPRACVHRSDRV
eukprot:819203-Pleurochrysis_carterae.AAC.1